MEAGDDVVVDVSASFPSVAEEVCVPAPGVLFVRAVAVAEVSEAVADGEALAEADVDGAAGGGGRTAAG